MTFFINMFLVMLLLFVIFWLYRFYMMRMAKKYARIISSENFRVNMRKAQVVDVREKDYFDAEHILGARNFPYSMMKQNMYALRKDQPIYLYDQSNNGVAIRSARFLYKKGYQDIYILNGGFDAWTGKTKKKRT